MQRTLAIIKPDAVGDHSVGAIINRIEESGLLICALRMVKLTKQDAEGFYAVHKDKPFFEALTAFMSSGPAVVLALEGENAIRRWRDLMGATNPNDAEPGTLRKEFGASIDRNATHGSDAEDTAAYELNYFFRGVEFGQ